MHGTPDCGSDLNSKLATRQSCLAVNTLPTCGERRAWGYQVSNPRPQGSSGRFNLAVIFFYQVILKNVIFNLAVIFFLQVMLKNVILNKNYLCPIRLVFFVAGQKLKINKNYPFF
ncbi:hypothetical protein HanRHA438_Chr14g0642381 [Helianthus annuus]|nr:hypothetical protein HanRHA438_Chr14g0642381 [Helianthus annuus]